MARVLSLCYKKSIIVPAWYFSWYWSKPLWFKWLRQRLCIWKIDIMSSFFLYKWGYDIMSIIMKPGMWHKSHKCYITMDVNAWAVNGNLCGTFIAHYILLGGGAFHKPLQYISYCTILNFSIWFFSEWIKPP